MKTILFIHGLGSGSDSSTGAAVQLLFPQAKVIIPTFDLLDVEGTFNKIKQIYRKENAPMIIGHSLGGFYALAFKDSCPKIVINPCMMPTDEISALINSVPQETLDAWRKYEDTLLDVDFELKAVTFGIFADDDPLFSYKDLYSQVYNNYTTCLGGHKPSMAQLSTPIEEAKEYFSRLYLPLTEQKLCEHFVNILTKKDLTKTAEWGPKVYDMLNDGYREIGGLAGCKDYNDLIKNCDMIKIDAFHGQIRCVAVYTFKRGGRKLLYITAERGPDGHMTPEGKKALYRLCQDDIRLVDRGFWGEASGAMEYIFLTKAKAPKIEAAEMKKILTDKELFEPDDELNDGFHYNRKLGDDKFHTKLGIGYSPLK